MESPVPWEEAPPFPSLPENQVQVWQTALPQTDEQAASFLPLLSPDETERTGRFLVTRSRAAFAGARGTLRLLLGAYLDSDPRQLRFCYNPQGKPALEDHDLCFNLSHSRGLALYAFSRRLPLGVDVECLRPAAASAQIARRFFSPREVAALEDMSPDRHTEAFFTCWTRKEAYLKARGEGLSLGLRRFAVSLDGPARLLDTDEGEAETRRWRLCALSPRPGYVGALCAAAGDWELRCFYR
ncbi:MAG: 4'-phosphopantetheinyl transferase superfamily protein [Candidatus Latescibacteria bacterium]|nr:4'-phosphopantetheinyl transferase superfamily protein [Candidatus Latescibacterota bacterium]